MASKAKARPNNQRQAHTPAPKKRSKRDRRIKMMIYIMVFAMLLTLFTSGLALFV